MSPHAIALCKQECSAYPRCCSSSCSEYSVLEQRSSKWNPITFGKMPQWHVKDSGSCLKANVRTHALNALPDKRRCVTLFGWIYKMSTPGIEPGLSRPQRDVLTTRRSRHLGVSEKDWGARNPHEISFNCAAKKPTALYFTKFLNGALFFLGYSGCKVGQPPTFLADKMH